MKGISGVEAGSLYPPDTILLGYRGSVAHGTYTKEYGPDSHDDKDILGIAIAPLDTYIGLGKFEQMEAMVTASDGVVWDAVTYEIRKAFRLLLGGNPNVMSLLWLPENMYIIRTELGSKIVENRDIFASRDSYHSFVGYAKGQLHRMTHPSGKHLGAKRRELVLKFGYDTKNASHLIRLLRMGIEFLSTGELRIAREDATELIEIKKGEKSLEWVNAEAARLFALADEALVRSQLPPKPDYKKAELLVKDILSEHLAGRIGTAARS